MVGRSYARTGMAIRIRSGSRKKRYEVYWNNPFTGKRQSLYFSTEPEAEKEDALIKYRLKYEREWFVPESDDEAIGKDKVNEPLESVYYMYLKERQFSKKSLHWQLTSMKVALNVFGNVPIGEITKQHIEKIKAFLSETGIKGTTVRGRLSVLRTVLRWAYRNGYLTRVPDMPDMPPADYEHIVPPTVEELERILAVSPPHLQRVIILGSQLGVRVGPSELFRLTWQDVDLARRVVRVPNAQKGAKTSWREVPIRNSLHAVFSEWKRIDLESGATFVVNWKGKPVQNVKTAWRTALEKACVRRMRRYDLRHAFATEGMAVGIDPGTMASLMGHSSPLMLMKHYQHVMTKQKVAAVESLPDVDFAASLLKGNVTECVQEHVSKGKGATDKL